MTGVHPFPQIDPDANQIITCFGRKGSGKSVAAREMFLAWPHVDRVVIDPTGDADPGPGAVDVRGKVPGALPPRRNHVPTTLRYLATPSSATYADDLDRAVGLALYPKDRRVLLWIDEGGEVFPANRTGPNARTLLKQSRHWNASAIIADPRPINLDPLVLAQSDRVLMYDVPNPADRKRLAEVIGWPPAALSDALDSLRGREPHSFLLYVAHEHSLYLCPPLPMSSPDKKAGT